MNLNINDMLYALSFALDCVEHDVVGVTTYHGKRVAYLTAALAQKLGIAGREQLELAGAAILHDNALTEYTYEMLERGSDPSISGSTENAQLGRHCVIGEENIALMPFRTDLTGCVLYHHENADGSGPFGKTANETPLSAQLVHLADQLDARWDLSCMTDEKYAQLTAWVRENRDKMFSPKCVEAFFAAISLPLLQSMQQENINSLLMQLPQNAEEYSNDELMGVARLFARIVDYKSEFTCRHSLGIAEKAARLGEYYGFSPDKDTELYLAGALHDIGKLVIDKDILEKPDKLTDAEYAQIKNHAFATYDILKNIKGMEEICLWASLHHEKLDGSGYPFGKTAPQLTKEERLMACIDIYQALTEQRPYKEGFSHEKAMGILSDMAHKGQLDGEIVKDIDKVFG